MKPLFLTFWIKIAKTDSSSTLYLWVWFSFSLSVSKISRTQDLTFDPLNSLLQINFGSVSISSSNHKDMLSEQIFLLKRAISSITFFMGWELSKERLSSSKAWKRASYSVEWANVLLEPWLKSVWLRGVKLCSKGEESHRSSWGLLVSLACDS